MEKTIVCVVSLVVGTGLGFLLAKSTSGRKLTEPQESDAVTAMRGSPTMGGSATPDPTSQSQNDPRTSTTVGAGPRNLDALLDLTNPFGSNYNFELYKKIDQFDVADIAALAEELERVPANDNRLYQVRAAVFTRWAKLDSNAAWLAATNIENTHSRGAAMNVVVGEIARTDLALARRLVDAVQNGQVKQTAMNGIVASGSQQNPELVFDMVNKMSTNQGSWQFHQLFVRWARDQPDTAIARLDEIQGKQKRNSALNGLVTGLAAMDPDRAISFAMGLEKMSERHQALSAVAANIASTDPERALEMLEQIPSGNQRRQMIGNIASTWSNQDVEAAAAWMQSLAPSERKSAMDHSIYQIVRNDPKAAAEIAGSLPMSNNNAHILENLANQWAQYDSDAAAAWVETLPTGAGRQRAVNGLVNAWQNDDPAKAAALLSKEGITSNNGYAAGNVFGNWVTTDRESAVAWLEELELGGDAERNFISSALRQWAQNGSSGAADYALGIADEKLQKYAVNSLMGSWGQTDPTAAKDWAMSNLQGDIKTESLSTLIQNLAHNDHTMALELYAETTASLTDEEINKSFGNVASSIAQSWSQYDAVGAAEWVMELPDGDQRKNSVRSVVANWSQADPVAASEFVGTLPNGSERDGAVESLVRNVQQHDPESAFIWAESIGDEQKRKNVLMNAAMQWKEIDADAAFQAVGSADISDKDKVSLLKRMQD